MFYNTSYTDFARAADKADGLAVVGAFFEVQYLLPQEIAVSMLMLEIISYICWWHIHLSILKDFSYRM